MNILLGNLAVKGIFCYSLFLHFPGPVMYRTIYCIFQLAASGKEICLGGYAGVVLEAHVKHIKQNRLKFIT